MILVTNLCRCFLKLLDFNVPFNDFSNKKKFQERFCKWHPILVPTPKVEYFSQFVYFLNKLQNTTKKYCYAIYNSEFRTRFVIQNLEFFHHIFFRFRNFGLFCDELINAISTFDNNCDLNISCIDAKI